MEKSKLRSSRDYRELPEIDAVNPPVELISTLKKSKIAAFFDYDGTLTPIIENPYQAFLSQEMREVLANLAKKILVAIVSGRDKNNLYELINLPDIFYIGNHGFDIKAPENNLSMEIGKDYAIFLQNFLQTINLELQSIPGALIEPKKYSVAIHYRNLKEEDKQKVIEVTQKIITESPKLKLGLGKQVLEALPNIDWDKGKAILWLIKKLNLDHDNIIMLYFGDDLTDENAFQVLPESSVGILVGHHSQKTYADYRIKTPEQVKNFLKKLMQELFN